MCLERLLWYEPAGWIHPQSDVVYAIVNKMYLVIKKHSFADGYYRIPNATFWQKGLLVYL